MPRVKMANIALTKITPDIAVTTELVVLLLKLSVLGLIRKPKWHATKATTKPNISPFNKLRVRFIGWTTSGK
jgi:hypothetical protein